MQFKSVLPDFTVNAKQLQEQLNTLLDQQKEQISAHIEKTSTASFDALVQPMELLSNQLEQFWSPVRHLHSVAATEELRKAYNDCLPLLTQFYTELSLDENLYGLYEKAWSQKDSFTTAEKEAVRQAIRDFTLAGVNLDKAKKEDLKKINQSLSELSTKFSNNVLDATDNWFYHVTDETMLAGLNPQQKALLKQNAEKRKLDGYALGIDFPSYHAVITYADARELRERVYEAFSTKASDQGPDQGKYDNTGIMVEILKLRQQKAKLLGFENYAAYSLATKMAHSTEEVLSFLNDIANKAKAYAEKEFAALTEFAKGLGFDDQLKPWDMPYYSEKQKQAEYEFDSEALRAYFPIEKVLAGMFEVVEKLFAIQIKAAKTNTALWNESVQLFEIYKNGQQIGQFYTDIYARNQKKGGAWMDSFCSRMKLDDKETQLPVAYLTCNFAPPTDGKVGLLSHNEVVTLFHEFGHCLHHLLSEIDVLSVSGIAGVPWDGVELPSQFLENWCWHEESLKLISEHFEDKTALPKSLLDKALKAKDFQAGMFLMRQLEFGLFDFTLHLNFDETKDDAATIQAVLNDVRKKVAVVPIVDYNRFQHAFSHIFAGGYAAGYYSYLWAEVLSSDAFSRFEQEGLFNPTTGLDYLSKILSRGGSEDFLDLFKSFMGRTPSTDAFLRHHGIG